MRGRRIGPGELWAVLQCSLTACSRSLGPTAPVPPWNNSDNGLLEYHKHLGFNRFATYRRCIMDLKDHSQRAAAGGTTEGRRGLGGGCGGPCFRVVEGWAVVRAAWGVGSAEAWVGRCVRDSRRSWTGRERAGDVGRRPGAPRRSGSAQGARSGASGARPPFWSRWRRPGGRRRGELELGPERDESAKPRTWTPGWSPVSRGAAGVSREGNYFAHVLNWSTEEQVVSSDLADPGDCRTELLRGSFLPARLESLFLRVRWLEDAPERRGCGGGGGGGRIGNGAGVERRRQRRRRAGPNGVNSPGGGGGGGQDPEGEAAAEPGSRLLWKPGLSAAEGFCGGRERTP
ncbi:uncharacterized protein LOC132514341 [Lagenorhynchus albirostris]|uniref:uncharacterized protein LOC132514341 n=1 Tax=Lagenorhynchus albirostris TaxID=27610 RepID=UPI0028E1E6EB|nr:uncharacterized protein LOC132514341 [Lagenorhynchus albirostris]